MIQSAVDELFMKAAVRLAERGLFTVTRGNPRVGCLIVKNGMVIGRGWHEHDGGPHAEIQALASCGDQSIEHATAYVTLEPCSWDGRTPPCTRQLITSNLRRVVVGNVDPHPNVRGEGICQLEAAGIDTAVVEIEELKEINPGYQSRWRHGRPWVRIKVAQSIDGRVAMASGESKWITCEAARQDVQYWRARSGAVLTGIGTVRADNPALSVRDERYGKASPVKVILDTQGSIDPNAEVFQDDAEVLVVVGNDAKVELNSAEVHQVVTPRICLNDVLELLAKKGINEVLVEAGPTLVSEFMREGLWDEFIVYASLKFLGSTAQSVANLSIERLCDATKGRLHSVETIGEDVRYVLRK